MCGTPSSASGPTTNAGSSKETSLKQQIGVEQGVGRLLAPCHVTERAVVQVTFDGLAAAYEFHVHIGGTTRGRDLLRPQVALSRTFIFETSVIHPYRAFAKRVGITRRQNKRPFSTLPCKN